MKIDSSVYDVNIEFGKLNCGDTFIYLGGLYIKANMIYPEPTGVLAVRLCDGKAESLRPEATVKLVKTKTVWDHD